MALDPLFGLHADALAVHRHRMDVIAGNLANSDTPNFKARDVDFAATLQQTLDAASSGDLPLSAASQGESIGATGAYSSSNPQLVWRVPTQNSVDGNTVDTQIEQAQFADAALHYQASLNFVDGRIKGLMTAITGQ